MPQHEYVSGDPQNVCGILDEALAKVLGENDADIGAQILGDWIVIAEVHAEEGPVLRLLTNEKTPLWRQQGLLTFAAKDLTHDMLLFRLKEWQSDS